MTSTHVYFSGIPVSIVELIEVKGDAYLIAAVCELVRSSGRSNWKLTELLRTGSIKSARYYVSIISQRLSSFVYTNISSTQVRPFAQVLATFTRCGS